MGMYNYVGCEGEQVKCFYVPCINVNYNRENKTCTVNFYSSGGRLENCNDAPYMTHYYNYGKDFAIIKHHLITEPENPYVHVFRDGKFVETVYINEMSDDYNLPHNVIDNWGTWINVHSASELKTFIKEHCDADKNAVQMETDALEQIGLSYKLASFAEMREKGVEAMRQEFQMREQISSEVHNLIWKPWIEKWEDYSRESDLSMIGIVLDDYLYDISVKKAKGWDRKEFEWYMIFSQILERLHNEFNNPLKAYFEWAEKQGIKVDKTWATELFEKYTKEPSDNLVKEYEAYLEKRGW